MDLSTLSDATLQLDMLTVQDEMKRWALYPGKAEAAEKARKRMAALKAECARRGIRDCDYTTPKPPRRLP